MALILCIETATAACSVALVKDGKPAFLRHSNHRNAHSSVLNLFIDEVISDARINYSDLDAIAVSKGPGSYTGLRIGVSSAKGLCYALDIPLIAPDTLFCMASGFLFNNPELPDNALLCPMIDARRMEVFTAVYDKKLNTIQQIDAVVVEDGSFENLPSARPVYYFGDGAEKCKDVLSRKSGWVYSPGFVNSASHMHQIVNESFNKQAFENTAYFEPFYLKEFIAGKPNVKGLH